MPPRLDSIHVARGCRVAQPRYDVVTKTDSVPLQRMFPSGKPPYSDAEAEDGTW